MFTTWLQSRSPWDRQGWLEQVQSQLESSGVSLLAQTTTLLWQARAHFTGGLIISQHILHHKLDINLHAASSSKL